MPRWSALLDRTERHVLEADETAVTYALDRREYEMAEAKEEVRCRPDLNRGMRVLQTLALPLGHGTGTTVLVYHIWREQEQ